MCRNGCLRKPAAISGLSLRGRSTRRKQSPGMDRKKLDKLRQRYADGAPGQSHNPEFKKIIDKVFAGTDRRPKPYEGVSTFLGAPLRLEAPPQGDFAGPDVA